MQGYAQSAQTPYALDNLRWVGDYIMKLHYSDVEFCAQARATNRMLVDVGTKQ